MSGRAWDNGQTDRQREIALELCRRARELLRDEGFLQTDLYAEHEIVKWRHSITVRVYSPMLVGSLGHHSLAWASVTDHRSGVRIAVMASGARRMVPYRERKDGTLDIDTAAERLCMYASDCLDEELKGTGRS